MINTFTTSSRHGDFVVLLTNNNRSCVLTMVMKTQEILIPCQISLSEKERKISLYVI